MLRYHRAVYHLDGVPFRTSWWQMGDRIFRHRTLPL